MRSPWMSVDTTAGEYTTVVTVKTQVSYAKVNL